MFGFNKEMKISKKERDEIVEFVDYVTTLKEKAINSRVDYLVTAIDMNGNIAGEIIEFLLAKEGLMLSTLDWSVSPKDYKKAGIQKVFTAGDYQFAICKATKEKKVKSK